MLAGSMPLATSEGLSQLAGVPVMPALTIRSSTEQSTTICFVGLGAMLSTVGMKLVPM